MVALLLEYGASVDVTDQLGYTPLMIASMKGSVECVRLLCESGANVNASNIHDGNTSLILTAVRRFDACSYLLLQHGADVEAVSLNGMTAFATAAVTGNMRMSVYVGVCKMMNAWPGVWKVLVLCCMSVCGRSLHLLLLLLLLLLLTAVELLIELIQCYRVSE